MDAYPTSSKNNYSKGYNEGDNQGYYKKSKHHGASKRVDYFELSLNNDKAQIGGNKNKFDNPSTESYVDSQYNNNYSASAETEQNYSEENWNHSASQSKGQNYYHQNYNYSKKSHGYDQGYSYTTYDNYGSGYNNSYNSKYYAENPNDQYNYHKPNKKSKKQRKNHSKTSKTESIDAYVKKHPTLPEKSVELIYDIINEEIECIICHEAIGEKSEIWSCVRCFNLVHIKCIYQWIDKYNKTNSTSTNTSKNQPVMVKWTCPACNYLYSLNNSMPIYNCYCEKYNKICKEASFDPKSIVIPHSCGRSCDKFICEHVTCTLPCHPGPHLPCTYEYKLNCYCSKQNRTFTCLSGTKKFSCEEVCGKKLKCGIHECKIVCHEGECQDLLDEKRCPDCHKEGKEKFAKFLTQLEQKILQETKEEVKFANLLTDHIFDGKLLCGVHKEKPNTEVNLKLILTLLKVSGTDQLIENIRKFIPICRYEVSNCCDCKSKSYKTTCFKLNYPDDILQFLKRTNERENKMKSCKKVCGTTKTCRIHNCDRVCCELFGKKITNNINADPNGYHICMLICGKPLECGKHKCEDYCHKGKCAPCPNVVKDKALLCDCGRSSLKPPYSCGDYPICKFDCVKERECEHACSQSCHPGDCPPCKELTFKMCRCGKSIVNDVVCGNNAKPICDKQCEAELPCGNHKCQLKCHIHTPEYDEKHFCSEVCKKPLLTCKHFCNKRCHGKDPCNEFECNSAIRVSCKCGVNTKQIKCGEFKKIEDPDHKLECNDECKKKERLRKVEELFDGLLKYNSIKHPNFNAAAVEASTSKISEQKFERAIINYGKKNLEHILEIESIIEKALKNLTKRFTIPCQDKNNYAFLNDQLSKIYNIKLEKQKDQVTKSYSLLITDASDAVLPKYRLSLICLLFKHHSFIQDDAIFHPFEYSITMKNYRYQITADDIENHLQKYCKAEFYYHDMVEPSFSYVHFFSYEKGRKVFEALKNKTSQFQDCYETVYKKGGDNSDDQEILKGQNKNLNENIYLYLKDQEYLYYIDTNQTLEKKLREKRDKREKKDAEENDGEDGFVVIKKK